MAVRATAAEVDQIMDLESSFSDTDIERYITVASAIVDDVLGNDTTLSSTLMEEIECWLAAHLIASTRARMGKVERLGEARIDYMGQFGKNLELTPYGQTVKMLDSTGKMGEIGKTRAYLKTIGNWDSD